jgi:hypothetical protein
MQTGYEKAIKNLLICEKRAKTLKEKAKTYSEIGTANALQAHCRITRKTLEKLGVL